MLEFKVIEKLKPNKGLTNILKDFKYKVILGQTKTILHTNLQVVIPTEYQITYHTTLTILEYKVNEISNKPFYIKEHNQKYNFKEIAQFLYLEKDENYGRLGRYGILILHFIAQNKQALYETLLMTNKLTHHLLLVSDSCENYYKELMENYIKNDERLSEKNKELNPLEWAKLINNYKNTAEEIVLNEYVFI